MEKQARADEQSELSPEELEQQDAAELPDREAMSLIDLGGGIAPPELGSDPPVYTLPYERPVAE